MKLAIVTACPGGQVTSVLAARLLRGAAERLGWETCVEANAGSRPEGELSAEQIAEADWVLLVGVGPLAAARFVGKPVYRARPAEALADPRASSSGPPPWRAWRSPGTRPAWLRRRPERHRGSSR